MARLQDRSEARILSEIRTAQETVLGMRSMLDWTDAAGLLIRRTSLSARYQIAQPLLGVSGELQGQFSGIQVPTEAGRLSRPQR